MKGFSYPAPTGPYKVCLINKVANWQEFDSCRIQVSIGNPRYEGEKYQALLEWAYHRFDNVQIVVSDTLQRHNIRAELNVDNATAWKIARHEGDNWLERNPCPFNFTFVRWDQLLNHPAYSVNRFLVDKKFETNEAFRQSVQAKSKHGGDVKFLLEEIAIFRFMFRDPAVDIYAGSWITDIFQTIDLPANALSVDFTRNKACAA